MERPTKNATDNWDLLENIESIVALGQRVLVGHSRKRFLREGIAAEDHLDPASAMVSATLDGRGVWAVRVHDVALTRTALSVAARSRQRHTAT